MIKIINPLIKKDYTMPTQVYFGRDSIQKLTKILKKENLKSTLFISGSHARKYSIFKKLYELGTVYPHNIVRSDFSSIDLLAEFIKKRNFDSIVAIGGGTILDVAKSANIISRNEEKIDNYFSVNSKKLKKKGLFLVLISTTSGTGSEVTPWATIWGKDKKYSLKSQYMFADISIVDSSLTDCLPEDITALSGIDALCQAIEAYWNVKNNPTSDKYALEAIEVIMGSLEKTVTGPTKSLRDKMAWGSLLTGLAFSNTQTTICHSVSYPISIHWGIPHGQAVAITLPLFVSYILPVLNAEKQRKLLKAIGAKNVDQASQKIINLMKAINQKTRLSELGIKKSDIDLIVYEGLDPDRAKNSPKIPSTGELKQLLISIY